MSTTVQAAGRVTTRRVTIPSRGWYWLAAVVAVLGLSLGVGWGVVSTLRAHSTATGLPRTSTPGVLEVAVDGGQSRLVYFEGDGRPSPDALGLEVSGPDGSPVAVKEYDAIMAYDIAGWVGVPIASFQTPTTGTYTVTTRQPYEGGRLAVGGNFVRTQAFHIAEAFALLLASFVCSVVLIAVVALRRSARKDAGALKRRGRISALPAQPPPPR